MEQDSTLSTEEVPETEELREKRKRATAAIDFSKLSNGEAEDLSPRGDVLDEPPAKKARTYSGLEHLPDYDLLQARQMLHVLSTAFSEVAKRVMKDKNPDAHSQVVFQQHTDDTRAQSRCLEPFTTQPHSHSFQRKQRQQPRWPTSGWHKPSKR